MSRRLRPNVAVARVSLARRRVCQWLLLPAAQCLVPTSLHAAAIASARVWPAQEYTRLILESRTPIAHQMLAIKNPSRLVLDLEDVELTSEIEQLPRLVHPDDPYIQSIRVGRFKPGVLRLVLDLKTDVNPQLFALQPAGDYGYRVVLDLYSLTPPDPLMALLDNERLGPDATDKPAPSGEIARPKPSGPARRPVIVAIDPGHGGEDPGAVGKRGTYEKNVTLAIARRLKTLIDGEPGMRAMLTRDDDYYRRAQRARAKGATRPGRSVHLPARRCFHDPDGAGLIGVRALGPRCDECRSALARAARERGRPDRRRQSGQS